eukprot:TRINITY_DN7269_c0_g1_i1.p1 TRINITY_DN7269_c0_g1~~TRINITY_DN7269_c0_g1_i1.p1  ORF type:complete len:227 (+),score=42.27 TRINITY_DN7269_c0_g1_i1:64-681(+)
MAVLPSDAWTHVAGFCDAKELAALQGVCVWMGKEMGADRYWGAVLTCRFEGMDGVVGGKEVYRRIVVGDVQEIEMKVVKNTGMEYSYNYRAELMLNPAEGVFCTAPGVCSADIECQPSIPFLLTEIHAKGAGRGYSSPLKKFATLGQTYVLSEPSEHHVFMPARPIYTEKNLMVQLLEGTKKDENIDTEYIGFFGIMLDNVTKLE